MFTIKDITDYTFKYSCECGVIGKCMFVPVTGSGSLVMDLRCPGCERTERLCINKDTDSDTLQWAILLDNNTAGEVND